MAMRFNFPRLGWLMQELRLGIPLIGGIAATIAALGLSNGLAAASETPAADIAPFAYQRVDAGVHVLATPPDYIGPAIGNVGIIEQRDGFVLVDAGGSAGIGRRLVAMVEALGPKPIKAVVITHWHNDHHQGLSAIRAKWPKVRIIATAESRAGMLGPVGSTVGLAPDPAKLEELTRQLTEGKKQLQAIHDDPATAPERRARALKAIANYDLYLALFPGTYIVPPTEVFGRRLTIADPENPVQISFVGRANTAGDAVIWLPRQRILFSGDIVVAPSPFGFYSFPGDWIETLGRLKAFRYRLLIPGHGEPQADAEYLDRLVRVTAALRAQVGPLAREGLTLEQVRERIDVSALRSIFGAEERLQRGFAGNWAEPMIENAWREAKRLPIIQGGGEVTVARQSRAGPATQANPPKQ
jgi:glyoxylase-like metal-dependent hydrolase (beta-lactamase superfamily II)